MPKKARTPIDVNVSWAEKEIPKVPRNRPSKYAPVLDKLMKKPDRVAVLGEFAERSAISLVLSLRTAAKKAGLLSQFTFRPRASTENPGLYKVYAQFSSEAPAAPEKKERKPRKPRSRNPVPQVSAAELDEKFPRVDDQKPLEN